MGTFRRRVELYKLANTVLNTKEQGFDKIKNIQSGSKGKIKLSTECYSFYQGLPSFTQKMALLYPEIEIDISLEATHQPILKILSNQIDIVIVTSKTPNNLLSSIELFEDKIYAVMHKENKFNKNKFLNSGNFNDIHLIIHSFPIETVPVYQRFLLPNKITPFKISAIPLTEVSLEMINANIGVMCMPKWALKPFKISGDLVFKKIGKHGLRRKHYLVVRKADRNKKYIRDFISNFKEDFTTR